MTATSAQLLRRAATRVINQQACWVSDLMRHLLIGVTTAKDLVDLTLEALRAVDRYGATETGQQYTGFKALPAGRAMPAASTMTPAEADKVLWDVSGLGRDKPWPVEGRLRRARAVAHPDRHAGDRTLWDQVEEAAKVLGVLS